MALPLFAFALPLASMLAVAQPVSMPASDNAYNLPASALAPARTHAAIADRQAMPRLKAPGYDGPWEFEGPSWSTRARQQGPVFEVGALGGGHEWAPYLAHVAVDWQF